MSTNVHGVDLVHDFGLHLLWWSVGTGEVVYCMELLGTKAGSGWVTAALALLLGKACPPLVWVVPAIVLP